MPSVDPVNDGRDGSGDFGCFRLGGVVFVGKLGKGCFQGGLLRSQSGVRWSHRPEAEAFCRPFPKRRASRDGFQSLVQTLLTIALAMSS